MTSLAKYRDIHKYANIEGLTMPLLQGAHLVNVAHSTDGLGGPDDGRPVMATRVVLGWLGIVVSF